MNEPEHPEGTEMTDTEIVRAPEPSVPVELPPVRSDEYVEKAMQSFREGGDLIDPVSTLPELSRWAQMEAIAQRIATSQLVPEHIRKSRDPVADCLVILLMAHDLGISITLAFQKTAVIDGKPTMQAELMRLLAMRDGHRVWFDIEHDEQGRATAATCFVQRNGDDEHVAEASFSLVDAVTAGLCSVDSNGNVRARSGNDKRLPWESYTSDMLVARATSRAMRRFAPDSLGGVSYTPEELGAVESTASTDYERIDAPAAVLEMLLERVERLDPDMRKAVARKFSAANIGTLKPLPARADGTRWLLLSTDEIPIAKRILDDAEREQPADAELVVPSPWHDYEGPDTDGAICATCGLVEPDPIHHYEPGDELAGTEAASEPVAGVMTPPPGRRNADAVTVPDPTGALTEPRSAADTSLIRLPALPEKKRAQRTVVVEVPAGVPGAGKYSVPYRLEALPPGWEAIADGQRVEFLTADGAYEGLVIGDYKFGEEPF